ncbi:MAG: putative metal-dependent hydrolase YabD [Nitrospirales bacterium]|nr:MAG: putative metal-dependent hydrolase YabD [Nitrospirales bacterium]
MLVDSHVHLDDERYNPDRAEIFERAEEAGVEAFVTIGCDLETSRAAVELADRHANVYATIGVHPHEVKHIQDSWYRELKELAKHPKVVGYGEIGLDFHYDHSPRDTQRQRFREQIQLAHELQLPVVIHTREAQDDTITILREEHASQIGGVIHCFSGDASLANNALDLGFYISFSGIITFRNASELREIVRTVPDDRLLIETDAPYLTPVPYRGKRNESAYIKQVAEKVAEVKEGANPEAFERIAKMTATNAKRLFNLR